jgi:hypothetical protein
MADPSRPQPIFKLMKTAAAARFLGRSASTLAKYRMTGEGPPFVKLGQAVRYDMADLQAYIARSRRQSTSARSRPAKTAPSELEEA